MKRRGFLWGLLASPFVAAVPALAKVPQTSYRAQLFKRYGLREEWRQTLNAGMFANFPEHLYRPLLLETELSYQCGTTIAEHEDGSIEINFPKA